MKALLYSVRSSTPLFNSGKTFWLVMMSSRWWQSHHHLAGGSYEKLLPLIQDMSDFRWPRPLRVDPSKMDHSKKCTYHKEHGHTTETCRSLHYLVEKLINYIHGGPLDEEYDSKRKRQRLLRAASVLERVNSIRPGITGRGP